MSNEYCGSRAKLTSLSSPRIGGSHTWLYLKHGDHVPHDPSRSRPTTLMTPSPSSKRGAGLIGFCGQVDQVAERAIEGANRRWPPRSRLSGQRHVHPAICARDMD